MGSPSPDDPQRNTAAAQYYTTTRQTDVPTDQGAYPSYHPGSVVYAVQRENVFPERPDQPECQFYMKTGDCKFGATCKFHHPRERLVPAPNCALSPIGLPLRPVRVSFFYLRKIYKRSITYFEFGEFLSLFIMQRQPTCKKFSINC